MVNYGNSKIYKICSDNTNKLYIGCTTKQYLSQRLGFHKRSYRQYKAGKLNYNNSFEILQYSNCKIILLESCNCNSQDELVAKEQHWIAQLNDVAINNMEIPEDKKIVLNRSTFKCDCGSEINNDKITIGKHLRTKKHKAMIQTKLNNQIDPIILLIENKQDTIINNENKQDIAINNEKDQVVTNNSKSTEPYQINV